MPTNSQRSGSVNEPSQRALVQPDMELAPSPGYHGTTTSANKLTADSDIVVTARSMNSSGDEASLQEPSQQHDRHIYPDGSQQPTTPRELSTVIKTWWKELTACFFAIAMIAIEIGLLAHFNNTSVTSWHFRWGMNSVLAMLTTLLEAALAFAVTTCMGQLRWLWFQKGEQGLKWMDKLSNANGAFGSVKFLFDRGAWRHWASLGAVLILAMLGTSVFTQEIVKQHAYAVNETSPANTGSRMTPIAQDYYEYQYGNKNGSEQPLIPMISAIEAGFMFPADYSDSDSINDLVNCTTGDCDFGLYSSLAVCSKCADISDMIVAPCDQDNCQVGQRIRLSDDSLSLDAVNGYVNITSDTTYPNASILDGIGPLIAHYKVLGWVELPAQAVECAVYWCVNTYEGNMTDDDFDEDLNSSWTDTSASTNLLNNSSHDITLSPPSCYLNNQTQHNCSYTIDATSHHALQNYLIGDSNSAGFLTGDADLVAANESFIIASTLAANTLISPCNSAETSDCITSYMSALFQWTITNMTGDMTNYVRKADAPYSYGTLWDTEQHYHVRWGWIIYPIAVVLAALLFVVGTVVKSRHTDPWKTSVVALMFHGFHDLDHATYEQLGNAEEMERATRDWNVSLVKGSNGRTGFVRHDGEAVGEMGCEVKREG